jgi:site-specific recombinase XerD
MNQIELNRFLDSRKYSWSARTLEMEKTRLNKYLPLLTNSAEALWNHLKDSGMSPYTRVSLWGRIIQLWDFCRPDQPNNYKIFKDTNRREFKNYYTRKELGMSFNDIRSKVNSIQEADIRNKAYELLFSGMRFRESLTLNNDQTIIGKGGKVRKIFLPEAISKSDFDKSYSYFAKKLKKYGLTAHMLRKAFATKFVETGAKEADLLKVMGWESIETAKYYLQPKKDEEIQNMIQKEQRIF